MFRLESFSSVLLDQPTEATFTRQDLDQAYADGFAEARNQSRDEELRALGDSLERLAASLADDDARRNKMRLEAVEALSPILTQILDIMAPPSASRRLEEALRAELDRLAQRSSTLTARIACNERLRPLVERCLKDIGITGIEIDAAPADRITVTVAGGRIELTPDAIASQIRTLISEIKEDSTLWTH
nr:hypothetical protein [Paracoccus saliphilus]